MSVFCKKNKKDGMMNKYFCMKTDCVHAKSCMRLQSFLRGETSDALLTVVNYSLVGDGSLCPHRVELCRVKYARGFVAVFDRIPQKVGRDIALSLSLIFGRNPYYKLRRGDRLITPAEQDIIVNAFHKHGIDAPSIFDSFEEHEEWVPIEP